MKLLRRKPRSRRRRLQKAGDVAASSLAKVPVPSNNPATNLLIGDIAMRGVSMIIGRGIEKVMLAVRYDADKAAGIVKGRTMAQSLVATSVARVATKSVPGFLVVSGGLAAKALFDRSFSRREAARAGDKTLDKQAAQADE